MVSRLQFKFLLWVLIGSSGLPCSQAGERRVFLLDPAVLISVRDACQKHDVRYQAAFKKLKADADKLLKMEPLSVMEKSETPPSGDKRDYMSLAPYYWPDPAKKDGLPYIRRDGEVNPEARRMKDHSNLGSTVKAVQKLSLAYFFTGDVDYAAKAASLLRVWFLDGETRMNPNLNYGQAVPGVNDGRGSGLIDTRSLSVVVDAIGLLEGSGEWTDSDQRGMIDWFDSFLLWMQKSPHGKHESAAANNHGVWFDVQFCSFALFTGQRDLALRVLNEAKASRIAVQIEPDGRMPKELGRTKSLSYTSFNLLAFTQLASIAQCLDVDLWNYQTSDGRCIRKALDWVLPYMTGDSQWEYSQIEPYDPDGAFLVLKQASVHYGGEKYREALQKMDDEHHRSHIANLLYGN